MTRSKLVACLGALALVSLALAGCASTSSGGSPSDEPSASSSVTPDPDLGAAWLDNGRMIGLVTLGSSTCIPGAEAPTVNSDGVLEVTLTPPVSGEACTSDLVPRVTLVDVPDDVDPSQDLQITVTGENDYYGEVELDGVDGLTAGSETDYQPSAGWATAAGQFVILTWGSSSCVPVMKDIQATGPAEVTVTYETPADDQVCTMDMAPRAQVAAVNDLEDDSDVVLILSGAEFENVRVPIYGTNS
jgi:hypothetical protein